MSTKSWLLIAALLVPILGANASPAENNPQSFQERWQLQFYPDDLPDQRPQLSGTEWVKAGDMNILGRRTDQVIRFPVDRRAELIPPQRNDENGMSSVLQPVEFTHIFHPGLPANEPTTETTEKYRQSVVVGPCIEYGGQVHTFHVVPGQQLLFHAVVPVNALQWYTVAVRFTGPPAAGRVPPDRNFRITEFLFEFGADPLKVNEGPLTIHYHSRDSCDEKLTIQHFHRTFRLARKPNDSPKVRRISTAFARDLLFIPEHRYALIDEDHYDAAGDELFVPLKE